MKTIIAGSRGITNFEELKAAIKKIDWEITEVFSGEARGADELGERYAMEEDIPLRLFPAKWKKFGRRAGYVRNCKMAAVGEALIALWDGESKGTKMMIELARAKELKVHVRICPVVKKKKGSPPTGAGDVAAFMS